MGRRPRLLPSFGALVFCAGLFLTLGPAAGPMFSGDGDHGRHVRLGRTILETGHIPTTDQFSHTMAGEPFVPFEWLSEVAFALADLWLGMAGMAVLAALLFAGAGWLTYRSCLRLGVHRFGALFAGLVALLLLAPHLLPRPHMFSTFLVAFVLLQLLAWRDGESDRRLWLLPPTFLVWANMHGGFLAGLIVLGVFWAEAVGRAVLGSGEETEDAASPGSGDTARWKPITAVAVASFAATLINPAGFEVIAHSLGYVQSRFMVDHTQEYLSIDFHELSGKLVLVFLAGSIGVLMSGRARVRFIGGILFVGWFAGALYARRSLDFFVVSAVPFVALWSQAVCGSVADDPRVFPAAGSACRRLRDVGQRFSAADRRFGGVIGGVVLAAVILWTHLGSQVARERYRFPAGVFPVEAVAWLSDTAIPESGPVYNHFKWGGYLLYEAWPRVPVFIDGQTDFYGEDVFREYLHVRDVRPGWDRILEDRQVTWVLVPAGSPLADRLLAEEAWNRAWADSVAAVFVRRP